MNHTISASAFRNLAAGFGDGDAVEQLIEAQRSIRRALLATVHQAGSTSIGVPETVRQAVRDAWSVLARVDGDNPAVVNEVIGHPYFRVWAVRCLEHLRSSSGTRSQSRPQWGPPDLSADLGHFGAIAAAVAIRASASATVTVPVVDGAVYLPTLGRFVPGELAADAGEVAGDMATLVIDGGSVDVEVAGHSWMLNSADLEKGAGEWQPVRKLRAPGICVALEDSDPYRDCHQWSAAPRLSEAGFVRWEDCFQQAWQTVQADHGVYAPALAAGLSVLMPLQARPDGRDISAAARQAFGAVGAALPDDPITLALLLIHEFQHVKLGAILDLYDLFDPADSRLYHAPWREDPRPFEGLLQGTYAHLAVTNFWRVREQVETGPAAEEAGQRYQLWLGHTRDAIETLAGSGSLTPLGIQFVNHMRQSV